MEGLPRPHFCVQQGRGRGWLGPAGREFGPEPGGPLPPVPIPPSAMLLERVICPQSFCSPCPAHPSPPSRCSGHHCPPTLSTEAIRAAVRRWAVSQGLAPPRGGLPPSQTSPQHSTGFSSRSWMPLRPSLQAPCHLPAPTCEGLLLLFRLLFGPLIPVTSITTSLPTTAESLSSSSPLSLSISRELRGCPRGGPHVSHSQHGQAGLIISPQMLLFLPR